MKRLLDILFAISHPTHWVRNHKYNAEWDALVNEAITNGTIRQRSDYTAFMGSGVIWTGSYPFSYCHPYSPNFLQIMPARRTVKRLYRHLNLVDMAEVRAVYK